MVGPPTVRDVLTHPPHYYRPQPVYIPDSQGIMTGGDGTPEALWAQAEGDLQRYVELMKAAGAYSGG
jgi:hypothetical protein